jgi:uncharacterized membrane-anchored protein
VIGSLVSGGAAQAFTDYRIHADGFSRILVYDRSLRQRQAGRLVQRLREIETYRMMALLALPMARDIAPEIARCEREFAELTASMASSNGADHERRLLDRLIQLAARIERLSAATSYRFGARRWRSPSRTQARAGAGPSSATGSAHRGSCRRRVRAARQRNNRE